MCFASKSEQAGVDARSSFSLAAPGAAAAPSQPEGQPASDAAGAGDAATGATGGATGAAAAATGGGAADTDDDEGDAIDPEVLAALPPDIQAEVLEEQRIARQMRLAQRLLQQQQRQTQQRGQEGQGQPGSGAGASAGAGTGAGPSGEAGATAAAGGEGAGADADLAGQAADMNAILATFPADVRHDVLLSLDDAMLAALQPQFREEARSLREQNAGLFRRFQEAAGVVLDMPTVGGGTVRARMTTGVAPRRPAPPRQPEPWRLADTATRMLHDVEQSLMQPPSGRSASSSAALQGPPFVHGKQLHAFVRLLAMGQPLGRTSIERVFGNLCAHHQVRGGPAQGSWA